MRTRTLPRLVLAIFAIISPALACASPQVYPSHAEGYPRKSAAKFDVTQDARGFVIRKTPPILAKTPSEPAQPRLKVGKTLTFDLAIFNRMAKQREADDASCC